MPNSKSKLGHARNGSLPGIGASKTLLSKAGMNIMYGLPPLPE